MAATSTPSSVMNTASDNGIGSGTVHAPGASRGVVVRRSARLAATAPAAKSFPPASDPVVQPVTSAIEALPESSTQVINQSPTSSALDAPLASLSQPVLDLASSAEVPAGPPKSSRTNKRARVMESPPTEEDFQPSEDPESEAIVSDGVDDDIEEPPPAKKARGAQKKSKAPPTPRKAAAKSKPAPSRRSKKSAVASASSVIPEKAEASGVTPVWSDSRQTLCSTLKYFNGGYQSGSSTFGGVLHGFLIDAHCGERPYVDDEVIITRIGGGAAEKDEDGNPKNTKPQGEDTPLVKTVRNTMAYGIPVAMIIGGKNKQIGVKLHHLYNVMGFYRITDLWFEKKGKKAFGKVRFEKVDLAEKGWWSPKDAPDPLPVHLRDLSTKAERLVCDSCAKESPRVYADAWMCLQPKCPNFYMVGREAPPENLTFNPVFLQERSAAVPVKAARALVPTLPQDGKVSLAAAAVAKGAMGGIVCPKCNACVPRVYWEEWRCKTKDCGFVHKLSLPPLSATQVTDPRNQFDGHAPPDSDHHGTVDLETTYMENYRKEIYTISSGNIVSFFAANKTINSRPGGPDDMFLELQQADLGLRRYAMAVKQLAGDQFTAHFTVNHGMPYDYVAAQDSNSFADAPPVIMRAMGRLTWAGQQTVPDTAFQTPNECLTLGYFEGCKIGYHDDGESTLGPTIATLSLGCEAEMILRMKSKYFYGKTKSGKLLDKDPVLPGCFKHDERAALKQSKAELSAEEYEERRQNLFASIQKPTKGGKTVDMVTLQLKHGDMVVMHGADVQKYYEHSIVPGGLLRFALTSREVLPELIDPIHHHLGQYTLAPEDVYDGN